MTYPNGRVLSYNYNTGLDSNISRLSSISDNSATLESYLYLGLGTVVERDHPQTNIEQTFINQNGLTGDAGDKYTGLDRFGRIVEEAFINAITKAYTDDYLYTYDRDSNVLTKVNNLHTAFNETYTYNGLNELTGYTRANGDSQSYNPDAVGNFTSVVTNGTTQTRTQNAQNELTSVSGATTPVYDKNGNLTTDEAGQTYTYDAWNRLVKVLSGTNIVTYSFDALGRRVTETTNAVTRDLFFDGTNIVEERLAGNSNANIQYVWCCVNTLVLRDRDTLGLGTLNERLYYQTDANNDVTALVDTTAGVDERYVYTPFGVVTVYTGTWTVESGTQYAQEYTSQGERIDWTTLDLHLFLRDDRPSLQIIIEPDPSGFAGGYSSLYVAMGDNPVNRSDPSGLNPWDNLVGHVQAMGANVSGAWNNVTNGTAAQIMRGHGQAMLANANSALSNAKDIASSSWSAASDFSVHAVAGWGESTFPVPDRPVPLGPITIPAAPAMPTTNAGSYGRAAGRAVAAAQGVVEVAQGATFVIVGGGEALFTAPAGATGFGAIIPAGGVVVAVGGALEASHGAYTILNASRLNSERPIEFFAAEGGGGGGQVRVTGEALAAKRKEFNSKKPSLWMEEARRNPKKYTKEQLKSMEKGDAPIGCDGKKMEIHHKQELGAGGTNDYENLEFLTFTEHRGKGNFKPNHPNIFRK